MFNLMWDGIVYSFLFECVIDLVVYFLGGGGMLGMVFVVLYFFEVLCIGLFLFEDLC